MSFILSTTHFLITALILFGVIPIMGAVSPTDELIRGFIYATKDLVDTFLARTQLPRLSMSTDPKGTISFQLDPNGAEYTAGELTQPCPLCRPLMMPDALVGTWHLVLWSRNFLLNTITELDLEIDRLSNNMPLGQRKSLSQWLADPPDIRCPQLVVLDSRQESKFEFVYRIASATGNGRSKSIVGKWNRNGDGLYTWHLSPSITLQLCTSFSNVSTANYTLAEDDFIVLNQIDSSLNRCANFIVLMRDYGPSSTTRIRDWLEQKKGIEGPFNKLTKVKCELNNDNDIPV